MTTMLTFKVELQAEGAVDEKYVQRSLEHAISHYRAAEGLSGPDDEGAITEFQVSALEGDVLIGGDDVLRRRLQDLLRSTEEGYDLHHYAARDALQVLARTWLADDKINRYDIEGVVRILSETFRALAAQPSRALDALKAAHDATAQVQTLNELSFAAAPGPLKDALEKALREANSEMDTRQAEAGRLILREEPTADDLGLIRNLDQGSASIQELDRLIALAEIAPLRLDDLKHV